MQAIVQKLKGDRVIWMVVIFLSLFSILSVYSSISTLAYKAGGNSFQFLFKHTVMLGLGFAVIYFIHKIKFKYFGPISQVLLWVSIIMLTMTLLFGQEINGAKRWLEIPIINLTFQTSDFAKVVLIVYVARMLNIKRTVLHDFKEGVWPIIWPVALVCILILPANFSTAAMLGVICLLLMFIGGVPGNHLLKILGIGLIGIVLIYGIGKLAPDALPRFGTWAGRVESFFSPDSEGNFQSNLAQAAIHDGGFLPSGPGTGSSRNYLPHPYSDMIYAFIIQEYGSIIGGFGLIFLYLILLFRTIKFSIKCPRHFGGLAAMGLGIMLTVQALINMAVSVHIFPTTGQPLPMISMGGTSTIFTAMAIGIILSVSRSVFNPEEEEEELTKTGNRPANTLSDKEDYVVA
jgi:cell division protein FtsW